MNATLVTRAEIARRLGVSRERVRQLGERADFPRPVGHVGPAKAWRHEDIAAWAHRRGRRYDAS